MEVKNISSDPLLSKGDLIKTAAKILGVSPDRVNVELKQSSFMGDNFGNSSGNIVYFSLLFAYSDYIYTPFDAYFYLKEATVANMTNSGNFLSFGTLNFFFDSFSASRPLGLTFLFYEFTVI